MLATEAITELSAHFRLDRAGADPDGNLDYDFDRGFTFTATILDDTHLQLTAPLPDLPDPPPAALARRLLEAGLNGAETGAGAIGRHPALGLALIEVVECGPLDLDAFRLRLVDFMLHAEYWRSEWVARVQAEPAPPPAPPDAMTFRL